MGVDPRELEPLLTALRAARSGEHGYRLKSRRSGLVGELYTAFNELADRREETVKELVRVARAVGRDGRLDERADVLAAQGTWALALEAINGMVEELVRPIDVISRSIEAVAEGDLGRTIELRRDGRALRGEFAQIVRNTNLMLDQLSTFAAEVTRVAKEVGTEGKLGGQAHVDGVSGVWKELTDNVNGLAATLTTQLRAISDVSTAVTSGDLTRTIDVDAAGEVAELKDTINEMIGNLRSTTERTTRQDWLNSNLARFSARLQGQRDQATVARLVMSEVTPLVGARHGAFYLAEASAEGEPVLRLLASYGFGAADSPRTRFRLGESLVGQAAVERKPIALKGAPAGYVKISSGVGEAPAASVLVLPVLFEERVLGVLELASFEEFTETHETFLEHVTESVGVVLTTIQANMLTEELLQQSQALTQELQSQSEELQAQQDELKLSNEELETQAAALRASEELLQAQQEELQQTNEELEEKAQLLEEQNRRIEIKNTEIELARSALEEKAEQLALSSRYKSDFLANMSHELRTPLNSLLILAKLLVADPDGNLSEKQLEFARTIHTAGSELLRLISDILDLSKVEAGKMEIHVTQVSLADEVAQLERSFAPLAEEKGLALSLTVEPGTPDAIQTDPQRLQQLLKNLLSNALKFTEKGSVALHVAPAPLDLRYASETLVAARSAVAFSVADTGIGIAPDKLRLVFEAFQQEDGTTSRRFGGTGLGLSISREIARLLGGEIHVESTPGEGSTFTLYLPDRFVAYAPAETGADVLRDLDSVVTPALEPRTASAAEQDDPQLPAPELEDDRDSIEPGDRVVLIVEDDPDFARTELTLARERGFKGIVALRGDTGLALARAFRPDAIVLDLALPVVDGWTLLERLKRHPATRHIPVHIVSGVEERRPALLAGAAAFVQKPASLEALDDVFGGIESFIQRGVGRLLVVEDDDDQRQSIVDLVGGEGDVEVVAVGSSEEALEALEREEQFDCMVLDLKLPKMTGFALLEKVKSDERFGGLPVIVYTARDLTRREETKLKRYAETIVVKDARSPERLLDETSLFLHRIESNLPEEKRKLLEQLHNRDELFVGKKVLVVDDDVRNVFALTSVLEENGMEVVFAENGRDGIATLKANPDVDAVLMDVMMPELDGYETMQEIRRRPEFERLPIIALTAKAMKGDRERSIAAGASDYIAKPVDTDQLLSLLRVWLYQ